MGRECWGLWPVEYEGSRAEVAQMCAGISVVSGGANISPGLTSENPVTVTAEKTLTDQLNVLISQKGN